MGDEAVDEALVDAFIAATEEDGALAGRLPPFGDEAVVQALANGREQDEGRWRGAGVLRLALGLYVGQALGQRLGHHDHARAATKGAVIDAAVVALGEVAGVVQLHF